MRCRSPSIPCLEKALPFRNSKIPIPGNRRRTILTIRISWLFQARKLEYTYIVSSIHRSALSGGVHDMLGFTRVNELDSRSVFENPRAVEFSYLSSCGILWIHTTLHPDRGVDGAS